MIPPFSAAGVWTIGTVGTVGRPFASLRPATSTGASTLAIPHAFRRPDAEADGALPEGFDWGDLACASRRRSRTHRQGFSEARIPRSRSDGRQGLRGRSPGNVCQDERLDMSGSIRYAASPEASVRLRGPDAKGRRDPNPEKSAPLPLPRTSSRSRAPAGRRPASPHAAYFLRRRHPPSRHPPAAPHRSPDPLSPRRPDRRRPLIPGPSRNLARLHGTLQPSSALSRFPRPGRRKRLRLAGASDLWYIKTASGPPRLPAEQEGRIPPTPEATAAGPESSGKYSGRSA
jgi:hypothetical protein